MIQDIYSHFNMREYIEFSWQIPSLGLKASQRHHWGPVQKHLDGPPSPCVSFLMILCQILTMQKLNWVVHR